MVSPSPKWSSFKTLWICLHMVSYWIYIFPGSIHTFLQCILVYYHGICCRMYKIFITNESMDKIRRFAFFSASSRIYIATQTTKHSGDRLKTYIHSLMYLYISNMCDMSFQRMIADWICGRIGKNHAYISSVKIHKMLFTFKTFYLFE